MHPGLVLFELPYRENVPCIVLVKIRLEQKHSSYTKRKMRGVMIPLQTPLPTIRRLPLYLKILDEYEQNGIEWISTTDFAERLKQKPIQIRKDMAFTGIIGQPKKGYRVKELKSAILNFLGWNNTSDAFLVGCGALGSALLGYSGFHNNGLRIVSAFDTSAQLIGKRIHGKEVFHIDRFEQLAQQMFIKIGIITVPDTAAQSVADTMVKAGILAIWNFAPAKLAVPPHIVVQREDLSVGLAVLSIRAKEIMSDRNQSAEVE